MARYLTFLASVLTGVLTLAGASLQQRLEAFADTPGTGIAVITSAGDTLGVNIDRDYMLASVMKFHQAVALTRILTFDEIVGDSVWVTKDDLLTGTWSPLRAQCPDGNFYISPVGLLDYTLQMSDNNCADILFDRYASPYCVDSIIRATTPACNFSIQRTEAEMHADTALARLNRSTPADAATLMHTFFTEDTTVSSLAIRAIMARDGAFGKDRLPAGISAGNATIYHKTGTGELAPDGHPTAVNDLGFVYYPKSDGSFGYYTVAVFLEDFSGTQQEAEARIAAISETVWAEMMMAEATKAVAAGTVHAGTPMKPKPRELETSEKIGLILLPLTEVMLEAVDRAIWKSVWE